MIGDLLPDKWRWVSASEVQDPKGRAIVSGPFGSNIGSRFFVSDGVPVIRGNNLTSDMTRFVDDGFVFITEEKAQELRGCEALPCDLVFTAAGTIGQVGLIPSYAKYPKYIISNKQLRLRLNLQVIDPVFAFYWLSGPEMVDYIQQRNTGSSVPLINLSILRNLPLPLPPLPEQRAIAQTLGALDEKIELNRKMNETLEAMARALFQSWFVDFDPVKAKAEGRTPSGMDSASADLFPTSFQDTSLGQIPQGWRIGRLDDLLVLQRGFDLPAEARTPGEYSVLAASGPSGTHNEFKIKGPGITTGRSGVLGKVFFVHEDYWPLNTSLFVKEFLLSRPHHAYYLLSGLDFDVFNAGSAVPTLNRNHIHNLSVVIPPIEIIENFEAIVTPLFLLKKRNEAQNLTLATTRDTLLPKLLSGEIRVHKAEKMMEAIV